jgi:uridine kinase
VKSPYTIAINSISGGGKTALATVLHESLPNSSLFCFDDFDETNQYPEDFFEWWKRGAALEEFDCPGMQQAVADEIQRGTSEFIILDYPFGREHSRFRELIDLSVFIDTPLDVAMARRILRDFAPDAKVPDSDLLERVREEMTTYLEKARCVYLDSERHKMRSDIVLDGLGTLSHLKDELLSKIRSESQRAAPRERTGLS